MALENFMDQQSEDKSDKILQLTTESISLAQAVKKAGIGGTGGQSKFLVKDGQIHVNGQVVTTPGFTLHLNDRFGLLKGDVWVVQQS
jgi:ribosome-associated protein